MYKLENNEEWTEDLKNAFKHGVTRAYISYTDNGELKTISENDSLVSIEIKDYKYVPKTGFIGQATSRMATIKLLNNEQAINLENKEIEIRIGAEYNGETHYINYGKFIVTPPSENDVTNDESEVVAYDYMIKANQMWENNIVYPCKLRALANAVCAQMGVTLQEESFTNENFEVDSNQFPNETCRTVLQNIAKCAFSWARIGQDNKLYFDFEVNDTPNETITNEEYKADACKRATEYFGPVNKVTYAQSNIQGQEEFVPNTIQEPTRELVIYDNLFAYTTEKRHELIQAGTRLLGFKYMPISQLDLIGLPYLDCNDIIELEDMEGEKFLTRNFNHTITYQGFVNDSIENESMSLTEIQYENKNSVGNAISRTEIIVDKQNQEITSIAENVTAQNSKISQITQTVDELNSKISEIADITISKESITGTVSLDDINQSEPITVQIRPTENISYLYPRNNLYPANDLFIKIRTLRFENTSEYILTQDTYYSNNKQYYSYDDVEYTLLIAGTDYTVGDAIQGDIYQHNFIDYELPYDLLYYNSEYYDEFLLDYGDGTNRTCQVIKRCEYDSNGNVVLKTTPETIDISYPTINLTDGNYIVSVLKYTGVPYNCYLFVRLMASNIYTTQFATRAELNTKIEQTASEINLEVSKKVGNDEIISKINQSAEEVTIQASKVNLSGYVTLTNLSTAGETTINGSNIITGTIDATKVNVTKLNADNIITGTLKSSNYSVSEGVTQEGTSINLNSGVIDTAGFKVSSTGRITATEGTIGGFSIKSTKLYNGKTTLTANTSGVYIGTDGISLGAGSTFKVTTEGKLTAISGTIGGFTLGSTNFTGSLSGIYDYNIYDLNNCIAMQENIIASESTLRSILDYNGDGTVDSSDTLSIVKIIRNLKENEKTATGTFTINTTNPKDCITIKKSGILTVSMGIGGINTTMLTTKNIVCSSGGTTLTGTTINGSNGTISIVKNNNIGTTITYNDVTTGTVTQTSLEENKKNIKKFDDNALNLIKSIDIYKYNLKGEQNETKKHIGFVIGDNYNYSQEVTSDENNGVDIYSFVSVCCKAIQELQVEIETLKEKVEV